MVRKKGARLEGIIFKSQEQGVVVVKEKVISALIIAGLILVGLGILGGIVSSLPGMETEINGITVGQLLGLILAGLMIGVIFSRCYSLTEIFYYYYGTRIAERFNLSKAVLFKASQKLSLMIVIALSWLIVIVYLETLKQLLGDWIALVSTLFFLTVLGYLGFKSYQLLEPILNQLIAKNTTKRE